MTDTTQERGHIEIGRVIQRLFAVLGRNFVTFFVLALLLVGLPNAVVGFFRPAEIHSDPMSAFGPGLFFAGLTALITSAILQGTLIYGTVEDLNGRRPSIGDSLAMGLRAFLPLIVVSFLMAIGLVFGFMLLIVPGLFLLCLWSVAIPALVAERTGIFGAFTRSAELTRGNRWRIFLLVVIWACAAFVVSMIVAAVTGAGAVASGGLQAFVLSPAAIIVNAVVSALTTLVAATGVAVLYVELREAREEVDSSWMADIFR